MLVDAKDVFLQRFAKTVRQVGAAKGNNAAQLRIAHLDVNDRIRINMMNKGMIRG